MADTLSRSTIQTIADEQQKDVTLDKVKEDTSLQLKEHPVLFGTQIIICDVGTGYSRPYIPPPLSKGLFTHFYSCHILDAELLLS